MRMSWLVLLHRYLGMAVGALMLMWCLSGVVMMYVSYPELDANLRLKNLERFSWDGCCKIPDALLGGFWSDRRWPRSRCWRAGLF